MDETGAIFLAWKRSCSDVVKTTLQLETRRQMLGLDAATTRTTLEVLEGLIRLLSEFADRNQGP